MFATETKPCAEAGILDILDGIVYSNSEREVTLDTSWMELKMTGRQFKDFILKLTAEFGVSDGRLRWLYVKSETVREFANSLKLEG